MSSVHGRQLQVIGKKMNLLVQLLLLHYRDRIHPQSPRHWPPDKPITLERSPQSLQGNQGYRYNNIEVEDIRIQHKIH